MILCIGDLHICDTRKDAIDIALDSIIVDAKLFLNGEEQKKYSECILLGDITNKTPTTTERLTFIRFLNQLKSISKKIIIIQGTDSHDYYKGCYNFADIAEYDPSIVFTTEYISKDTVFGHYEMNGCVYSNGLIGTSLRKPSAGLKYYLGHIHKPGDLFNGAVTYVGSVYHVTFGEVNEGKRFLVLNEDYTLRESIPIVNMPMLQVPFIGLRGELSKAPELKKGLKCDLKIIAEVDTETKLKLLEIITKLKSNIDVKHYSEDIKLVDILVDTVTESNEEDALKDYCKQKKYNHTLIEKELHAT